MRGGFSYCYLSSNAVFLFIDLQCAFMNAFCYVAHVLCRMFQDETAQVL